MSHPTVPPFVRAGVFWRRHEREEIRLIRRHLPANEHVVELGAGFGVTGAHILDCLNDDRRLVAVEANPMMLKPLRRTLDDPRVRVVHAAVDSHGDSTTAMLSIKPHAPLQTRVGEAPEAVSTEVPALTLTEILSSNDITGRFSLVADVEGAEAGLLLYEADAFASCGTIVIEIHNYPDQILDARDVIGHLNDLGYSIVDRIKNSYVFKRQ